MKRQTYFLSNLEDRALIYRCGTNQKKKINFCFLTKVINRKLTKEEIETIYQME